jgi:hypothetical protein
MLHQVELSVQQVRDALVRRDGWEERVPRGRLGDDLGAVWGHGLVDLVRGLPTAPAQAVAVLLRAGPGEPRQRRLGHVVAHQEPADRDQVGADAQVGCPEGRLDAGPQGTGGPLQVRAAVLARRHPPGVPGTGLLGSDRGPAQGEGRVGKRAPSWVCQGVYHLLPFKDYLNRSHNHGEHTLVRCVHAHQDPQLPPVSRRVRQNQLSRRQQPRRDPLHLLQEGGAQDDKVTPADPAAHRTTSRVVLPGLDRCHRCGPLAEPPIEDPPLDPQSGGHAAELQALDPGVVGDPKDDPGLLVLLGSGARGSAQPEGDRPGAGVGHPPGPAEGAVLLVAGPGCQVCQGARPFRSHTRRAFGPRESWPAWAWHLGLGWGG